MARRLSHYLSIILLWLLSTAVLALELTPEEKTWLAAHPVLRVGIDPAWPPYEFVDKQGQFKASCRLYGVNLKFLPYCLPNSTKARIAN